MTTDTLPDLDPAAWIDKAELAAFLGVSTRELRERLMKQADFPRGYQISSHRIYWRKTDVATWLARRKA